MWQPSKVGILTDIIYQNLVPPLSDTISSNIERVELFTHRVSDYTEFLFVRLSTVGGQFGWGEASFNQLNGQVVVALGMLVEALEGSPLQEVKSYLSGLPAWKYGRAYQIALSALEQALNDVEAQWLGVPFGSLFGSRKRDKIDCYANINRGTTDRSRAGWAKRAERAITEGFSALKIAPFDRITDKDLPHLSNGFLHGIDTISAVRDVASSNINLMLDCHWRFCPESAIFLVDEVERFDLGWLEAPILEDHLAIGDLCKVRRKANELNIKLAGGEYLDGLRATAPFLKSGAFDVINPDIRLCGVKGALDVAVEADAQGILYAPHNHLGPVMTAVNLHLLSVVPHALTLEMQFEETDIDVDLIDPGVFTPVNGRLKVPEGSGLGIDINMNALSSVPLH